MTKISAETTAMRDSLSLDPSNDGWVLRQGNRSLAINESAASIALKMGARCNGYARPAKTDVSPGTCSLVRQFLEFYFFDLGSLSKIVNYTDLVMPKTDQAVSVSPASVSYLITMLCNMNCVHCYNNSGKRDPLELTSGQRLKLIDYLCRWGVRRVTFTGGEPLLHPDLAQVIRMLAASSILVKVSTNGWSMSEEFLQLVQSGKVHQVNISIDGASEEIHDRYRCAPGSYQRVMSSLAALRRAKVRLLNLNVSVHPRDFGQLDQICRLAARLGVNSISFKPILMSGRADVNRDTLLPRDKLDDFRKVCGRLRVKYQDITIASQIIGASIGSEEEDDTDCSAGRESLFIDSNGDVLPCETLRPLFPAPNFREFRLAEIWLQHDVFRRYRDLKAKLRMKRAEGTTGCPASAYGRGDLVGGPANYYYKGEPL